MSKTGSLIYREHLFRMKDCVDDIAVKMMEPASKKPKNCARLSKIEQVAGARDLHEGVLPRHLASLRVSP